MKKLHSITDTAASTHLGKKSEGSAQYNPSLLVAVPREENRKLYNLDSSNLPFFGYDVWHAYEFSTLTQNGLPVTRVLKLKYNCNNDYLVESKSLKLYLNSFNMTKTGVSTQDCISQCKKLIEKDLSEKLQTKVEINFLDNKTKRIEIFNNYKNLTEFVDENNLNISKFKEAPEVLHVKETGEENQYYLTFDSLRSNCRVTHQPDFGDVFIYYKSQKHIEEASLIEYLVSFRSEYHFHEECCEMIFKRLYDILNTGDRLFVCALYTRRGGIDICPSRWSKNFTPDEVEKLLDLSVFARHGLKL